MQTFGGNYVPSATYDNNDTLDAPGCHPGTRVSFLNRLSNWVKDPVSPVDVVWLHGHAGAGKSAVARSFAEGLDAEGLLAGSFFFFRTDSRRNSEKSFVMTLAYQIARSMPVALGYITKAVEDDPTICSRSLQTQFEMLIVDPVAQISTSEAFLPKLVIIDGLDECADRKARSIILKSIFDNLPRLRGHLRFLITSRPAYDIQRSFKSAAASHKQHVDTIELLGDLHAHEDIRIYLRDNLERIKQAHALEAYITPEWPSDDEIERLAEESSGRFVYASTAIKYIENGPEPQQRLDDIIKFLAAIPVDDNIFKLLMEVDVSYLMDPANELMTRSLNSNVKTRVTFVNIRASAVHLWWRDFKGQRVSYGSLSPSTPMEMITYVTHPWVITDEETGASLGIWHPTVEHGILLIK